MDVVNGAHVGHGHGGSTSHMNITSLGMGMGGPNDGKPNYKMHFMASQGCTYNTPALRHT